MTAPRKILVWNGRNDVSTEWIRFVDVNVISSKAERHGFMDRLLWLTVSF
jgi:hypothetical protein